jgi:hypothetical protein
LLRSRPAGKVAPAAPLDPGEVADSEASIALLGACRRYASELAVSEVTLRAYTELQQYLDTGTHSLVEGLRGGETPDRPFRRSQVEAALPFCAKLLGPQYAALLSKAAEVATNSDRKAAVKA